MDSSHLVCQNKLHEYIQLVSQNHWILVKTKYSDLFQGMLKYSQISCTKMIGNTVKNDHKND